jgi:hypothetical protein
MAWFQKPGSKVSRVSPTSGRIFKRGQLLSLLGGDYVLIPLLSEDFVVARKDWADESQGLNDIATTLSRKQIHGPALVAEPTELDE